MNRPITNSRRSAVLALTATLLLGSAAPPMADTLFVSSFAGGEIYRVELPDGTTTTVVSDLDRAEDGACHPAGQLYFAESFVGNIIRFDPDGSNLENVVPTAGSVDGPEGLSFDSAGNLYFNTRQILATAQGAWILDGGDPANSIRQIVPPFTSFGEGTEIVVAGPHEGALLLVARGETRIYISEPPGAPPQLLIDSGEFPPEVNLFGIVSNGCGEIYVSYKSQLFGGPGGIRRFDPDGRLMQEIASIPEALFIDLDTQGNLYVAEGLNSSVLRISPGGTTETLTSVFDPTGIAVCRAERIPSCLVCDAGGPYVAECTAPTTCIRLDATHSFAAGGRGLAYSWTSDCPDASFDDPGLATPELCIPTSSLCSLECTVSLTLSDGITESSCQAPVRIEDSLPPTVSSCALKPAAPPGPASSAAGPALPAPPLPPAPAASPCSGASSALVVVDCGEHSDACDPEPRVEARILATRWVIENGECVEQSETVPVACDEPLELVRLAPPCPARPPSSPPPVVVVGPQGHRVISGATLELVVEARDECDLMGSCSLLATEPGGILPCPPRPPPCPVPPCGQ